MTQDTARRIRQPEQESRFWSDLYVVRAQVVEMRSRVLEGLVPRCQRVNPSSQNILSKEAPRRFA